MIADYKVKLFQAQRDQESMKKKLETAIQENKTLKQEIELSPLKTQLDNLTKQNKPQPTQNNLQSLVKYMTYIIQTVSALDRNHFARSCFEERFPKDNNILELFRNHHTDLILLKSFRYISDLLINIVSYTEFTNLSHVKKHYSPSRSAEKSNIELALDQLKASVQKEFEKNSFLSPTHKKSHSKTNIPASSTSMPQQKSPTHQSLIYNPPSGSDNKMSSGKRPPISNFSNLHQHSASVNIQNNLQSQFGRISPIQQSVNYNNQGEFLITDTSDQPPPDIKPFPFGNNSTPQDKIRSPNQEQLRNLMTNQIRPATTSNSGQKQQLSNSQPYFPPFREFNSPTNIQKEQQFNSPSNLNANSPPINNTQSNYPSFRLNMERANEIRKADYSSDSYSYDHKSLSTYSQVRESNPQSFNDPGANPNQVYVKEHYLTYDDRLSRPAQNSQQYNSLSQNRESTNSFLGHEAEALNNRNTIERRTSSIEEKPPLKNYAMPRNHQSVDLQSNVTKPNINVRRPSHNVGMERIQEEQEGRTSQPHSGKNSRVNSINQKQNQSINSRSSKSPTNTSRVSFGRTDPNPKNLTERALNYIQEVPRKKKFEQNVYRTYDPIKGEDLRNKSKSPEPILSSPTAQTLQVSPTQNPSQGQAQQSS